MSLSNSNKIKFLQSSPFGQISKSQTKIKKKLILYKHSSPLPHNFAVRISLLATILFAEGHLQIADHYRFFSFLLQFLPRFVGLHNTLHPRLLQAERKHW